MVEAPVAFFPLTSQALQSFPLPDYGGSATGATIASDFLFGAALSCSENDRNVVSAVRVCRRTAPRAGSTPPLPPTPHPDPTPTPTPTPPHPHPTPPYPTPGPG